jgi:hypothetical protein
MDPTIHSVANATPNYRLKSTPSLIHTTARFLFTARGAHLVSKCLPDTLISTICTNVMFILTIWTTLLENQTHTLPVFLTRGRMPPPQRISKPRGRKSIVSLPRPQNVECRRNLRARSTISLRPAPRLTPPPHSH